MALVCLIGCPPFPEEGPYRCEQDDDCQGGSVCRKGACSPDCIPKTCADLAGQCGHRLSDECGGTIACSCATPATCGGGGQPGFCGCLDKTCADYTGRCGSLDDGCNGSITCDCVSPQSCGGGGTPGVCGCSPMTCFEQQVECGLATDGCGSVLDCGPCAWPERCAGDGTAGKCGRPAACESAGAVCGYVNSGEELVDCGTCQGGEICGVVTPGQCGRPAACASASRTCGLLPGSGGIFCGTCAVDQLCAPSGQCIEAERPFCWSDPVPFDVPSWNVPNVHLSVERGTLWANSSFEPTDPTDTGCRRFGRIRLVGTTTTSTTPPEPLAASVFDDFDEAGCNRSPGATCDGWVSAPFIRSDGLEMFFHASYPCGDWWDRELYTSFRSSLFEPWSRPIFLSALSTYVDSIDDCVQYPVLLPGNTVLLYRETSSPHELISYARRPSTAPGDPHFQRVDHVAAFAESHDEPGERFEAVRPQSISCDQRYLLYYRAIRIAASNDDRHEARMALIESTDPPRFGTPQPYDGVPVGHRNDSSGVLAVAESPDCSALFYATRNQSFVRQRIPCP